MPPARTGKWPPRGGGAWPRKPRFGPVTPGYSAAEPVGPGRAPHGGTRAPARPRRTKRSRRARPGRYRRPDGRPGIAPRRRRRLLPGSGRAATAPHLGLGARPVPPQHCRPLRHDHSDSRAGTRMWRRRAGRGAGRATVGRCGAGSLARGAEEEPWAAGLAVGGGAAVRWRAELLRSQRGLWMMSWATR